MTQKDVAYLRLHNQHIIHSKLKTPKAVVAHLGAIQAQDYPMSKWAIGSRLKSATTADVQKAIDKGDIIRTHVLRPTWHIISAKDIYWMLELTKPQIMKLENPRLKQLGITPAIIKKSHRIFENLMSGGKHVTREELITALNNANIPTDEYRAAHIMHTAEMEALICSGADKDNKITYAWLPDRVPEKVTYSRDEALEKLASIYFKGHGPATLADFTWWSGLTITDAKKALGMIQSKLKSVYVEDETYWMSKSIDIPERKETLVHLLPSFDEYIIAYKNRSAAIHKDHQPKAFTINGIFHPIILVNGVAVGLWKRKFKKDEVHVETELFKRQTKEVKQLLEAEAERYAAFLGMKLKISHS